MALSHILHAITAEADADIRALRQKHDDLLRSLDADHASALSALRHDIAQKKTERLHSLRSRAEGHINMKKRHAVLQRKQHILDALYADTARALGSLPTATLEKLMTTWIKGLPKGGVIRPSTVHTALIKKICGDSHTTGTPLKDASGGFVYESETMDRDYTFEFLIRELLRPTTEIDAAHQLFGL